MDDDYFIHPILLIISIFTVVYPSTFKGDSSLLVMYIILKLV